MTITLGTPSVDSLPQVLEALSEWQRDSGPSQLHPGDVGWFQRLGAEATAAAVRTWSRDGRVMAVGLLDEPDVLRLTTAPELRSDPELAERLVEDLGRPDRGVLPEGRVCLEAPTDALVRDLLARDGWVDDARWSPLWRDLADPVEDPGLTVVVTAPERVAERVAVHRAAFERSTFTVERWRAMAAGPAYAEAACLVAYDGSGDAVGATTVWSAGPGHPGLIEPLGVHREHRGRGHGRALTLAAAAALREMGSSSVVVCTPSSNVAGVAAYASAGFRRRPDVPDLCRPVAR